MMQVDMNLAFPLVWEQDKCGSSDPIGIGALDVKISHLECSRMIMRPKSSFTRQFRVHNGQIDPCPSSSTISTTYGTTLNIQGHGVLKGYWRSIIVYDHRLVRVVRYFQGNGTWQGLIQ